MHNISLSNFKSFFPDAPVIGLGDDFFIMDVQFNEKHKLLQHPCRFDGFMVIYCLKGRIRLNVNLEEYELSENMLFLYLPGNLIRINELVDTKQEDMHFKCIGISKEFISGLMFDVNRIFTKNISIVKHPCITLPDTEARLLSAHHNLLTDMISSQVDCRVESIGSIVSSALYLLISVWTSSLNRQEPVIEAATTRSRLVFEQFIKLVSEYHTMYRNVGFYADKLCLTPKYLSRIIKEASGKSAPEWIDSYVILEAKNLLKYSNLAIKEIVYRLNFPNQSVFYKFFKARTGMTPTDYRNS